MAGFEGRTLVAVEGALVAVEGTLVAVEGTLVAVEGTPYHIHRSTSVHV